MTNTTNTFLSRDNNFDLVRLFAALEVFLGHAYYHLEISEGAGAISFLHNFPGVIMFFTISGFLITAAFDRNPNIRQYCKNRFLRIYPALWICFILSLVALSVFHFVDFKTIASGKFWAWTVAQLSVGQFYTPDFLRGYGVGAPNGSLWTIPVEISFYILLPFIFLCFKKVNLKVKFLVCAAISVAFNVVLAKSGSSFEGVNSVQEGVLFGAGGGKLMIFKLLNCSVAPYFYNFALGSLIYLCWDKVKILFQGKFLYWLAVLLLASYVFGFKPAYHITSVGGIVANIFLGIMTISAAYTLPKLGAILKHNDISYGMYIYHMIVINIFVELNLIGNIWYLLMVFILVTIMTILSWRYVEKFFLSLKYRKL